MGLGLTTQLQRQVGTQIAKLIIFTPTRVNLNKRNSIHPIRARTKPATFLPKPSRIVINRQ